ncbi:hypothetical protein OG195_44385 (plasmid) [Streptomyces sp. NBC_01362]|uniref:hypothetical protein n=1 Tax=Streptomyces sp. NBC_01362 TaxID=2903839 RepID=UPI002E335B8D|nr:hypothetical protein [Streptomyces sp. NBC_01362]
MSTPRERFDLITSPMTTANQRKLWTLCYQRVVGPARSEIRMDGGRRRLDIEGFHGEKMEFQQAKESIPNTHGKELSHASGIVWVYCVINQVANGDLYLFRQGSCAGFTWNRAWTLIGSCNGRVFLDLGYLPLVADHVLLEVNTFEVDGRRATGSGVLHGAQDFCHWMRDGLLLPPYSWTPRAA